MGKGKKKGQVQDDWENEMEEIAAEATGIDLTISLSNQKISFSSEDTLTGRSESVKEPVKSFCQIILLGQSVIALSKGRFNDFFYFMGRRSLSARDNVVSKKDGP